MAFVKSDSIFENSKDSEIKKWYRQSDISSDELAQNRVESQQEQNFVLRNEPNIFKGVFDKVIQEKTDDFEENKTGLPNKLKLGIEQQSGYSMDDVDVHFNSLLPDKVDALAYTQGSDIYVAPGQEQHLPHEAWHVVQQKQGRVEPTIQMKNENVNDDEALEHEADVMGEQALKSITGNRCSNAMQHYSSTPKQEVTQLQRKILNNRLNPASTAVIGINLMPSGGLSEILPGNGRGYSELSDKIAGHSSIISGNLVQNPNNPNNLDLNLTAGKGFSPDGFLRSALVGLTSFLPLPTPINVRGDYHNENQNIVDDIRADQLLIYVTPQTQQLWENAMNGVNGNTSGGIYSYNPTSASESAFDGNGTDNCTTIALRNVFNICTVLLNDQTNNRLNPIDIQPLIQLQRELLNMMNYIVNGNLRRGMNVGTQGRAMAAFSRI